MLTETTRALSRLTRLLTAATIIRDANLTIRNAIVSALSPTQAMLVLVLSNGHVENRLIEVPPGLTLQDLGKANEVVTKTATGKTLRWLAKNKPATTWDSPALEKLVGSIWMALRSISKELTRSSITIAGEEFLFGQPEFQRDMGALSDIVEALKHSDVLVDALTSPELPSAVTIGRENRQERLWQFSVVRRSFFVGGI